MESTVVIDINVAQQKGATPNGVVQDSKKPAALGSVLLGFLRDGGSTGGGKTVGVASSNGERMKVMRKYIHSVKVGAALVLVSLLYFLDPLYKEVGDDNAIWAIMTVAVIFEFHAGATVSKGTNRVIGTVVGGGFGCLVATTGQKLGGIGNSIIVAISVFSVAGGATYFRQTHTKKVFDYGANIFILTFSLVAVSGLRIQNVIEIARERLLMILLGFMTCIFTSFFVFPIWASDELHSSLSSRFHKLSASLQGCVEEYFRSCSSDDGKMEEEECSSPSLHHPVVNDYFKTCEKVFQSNSKDESLVIAARWEPWHGKFGLSYPWDKYKRIGEVLNHLAASILSLNCCLKSPRQAQQTNRESIKEPCEAAAASLVWAIGELGDSICGQRRCNPETSIVPELKSARLELSRAATTPSQGGGSSTVTEVLGMSSFVFGLMEIVEVMEELVKEVDELGQTAGFHETKPNHDDDDDDDK